MTGREETRTASAAEGAWSVWRQDDHGNRFEVRQGLSQADALRLVAEFEARVTSSPTGLSPVPRSYHRRKNRYEQQQHRGLCLCSCTSLNSRSGGRLCHRDVHQLADHSLQPGEGKGESVSGIIGSSTLVQRLVDDVLWVVKPAGMLLGAHRAWDALWGALMEGSHQGTLCGHVRVVSYSSERTAV
jgi:hypothetical protein